MKTSEQELIDFAEEVRRAAIRIAGQCSAHGLDRTAMEALELCTRAASVKNGAEMQQEQTGNYDLAALKVDATTPSISETGWERED